MSLRKISKALSLRLFDLGYATAYENAPFNPQANEIYLRESILPARTVEVGIESGSTDNFSGIYQVSVNAPRDGHKTDAQTAVEAVEAHFVRGTVVAAEGVEVRVYRTYASAAIEQGDRYVVPVSIEYRALVK